jgi:hypothetical protein
MLSPRPRLRAARLDTALEEFKRAMDFADADLAAWLEIAEERLPALGSYPLPDPTDRSYPIACQAIAAMEGCDAWSLGLLVLWAHGRR